MMQKNPRIDAIRLDGGVLCLDFVNTIPDRVDGTNRDNLSDFSDLIYWSRKAGVIDTASMNTLEKSVLPNEKRAKDVLTDALALRSLVYLIFSAVSHQQKVKSADLEDLNTRFADYRKYLRIEPVKDGFLEQWHFERENPLAMIAPVAKSARDLILSDKLKRIKECPNCGWLFLDTTKNGKRRWCSMEDCGSNVKSLEYYYRNKRKKD